MLGSGMADTLTCVRMAAFSVVHGLPQFSPSQPASLYRVQIWDTQEATHLLLQFGSIQLPLLMG